MIAAAMPGSVLAFMGLVLASMVATTLMAWLRARTAAGDERGRLVFASIVGLVGVVILGGF